MSLEQSYNLSPYLLTATVFSRAARIASLDSNYRYIGSPSSQVRSGCILL